MMYELNDEGMGYTQVELAQMLGISKQAFTNKMSRDNFRLDEAARIVNYLGYKMYIQGNSRTYEIRK